MMPKGVEHKVSYYRGSTQEFRVSLPMMPKGVEHQILSKTWEV